MTETERNPNEHEGLKMVVKSVSEVETPYTPKKRNIILRVLFAVIIFSSGLGSGYLFWGQNGLRKTSSNNLSALSDDVNPKKGLKIQATYGKVGPKLLAAGTIDIIPFEQLYKQAGKPLSEKEITILTKGSQDEIVITPENAYFLLNYFWALGLTNKNPVLDNGPIQTAGNGKIDGFASTGGWTIGTKPVTELFSSKPILILNEKQQIKVEEVAKAVYRPCCDNSTHLPDCNHGMAMLGLLELMAAQDATTEEMFQAAKYANAFWFPQQTLEQATYFKVVENMDYQNIDAKLIVSQKVSAGSSFQQLHQWLVKNNLLEQSPKSGNNCTV